ncbi:hypothetical protein Y032_0569g77 [Ancylostoma ceylanicum]|uniref:Uncharacterized protein n=1 Tax=Ancylostoma ceylanicum TaxID=53326 RepID=A0A016WQX3_9BILA|nr:hypothetical protein Y032_0569g77 [Ancylostoma ceylanicum]
MQRKGHRHRRPLYDLISHFCSLHFYFTYCIHKDFLAIVERVGSEQASWEAPAQIDIGYRYIVIPTGSVV